MAENFRMELVVFNIANIDLPFNAIIGRLALYRFMATTHYVYQMIKIPAPNGIIMICTDRNVVVAMVETLCTLAAAMGEDEDDELPPLGLNTMQAISTKSNDKLQELEKGECYTKVPPLKSKAKANGSRSGSGGPSSTRPRTGSGDSKPIEPRARFGGSKPNGPSIHPDGAKTVPMKTIQIEVDSSETTRVGVGLGTNRNLSLSLSSGPMLMCLPHNHVKCLRSPAR
jgi:hypothetical protein